jgi:hypothetical protein
MDEHEAAYLRQQIRELQRAKNRWKVATLFLLAAFGLFLVLGMGSVFTYGLFSFPTEARRAREAEMAEMRARQAEMQAQQALEKATEGKNAKAKTGLSEKRDSKR